MAEYHTVRLDIERLRKAAGETYESLSRVTQTSKATLYKLRGGNGVRIDVADRILKQLSLLSERPYLLRAIEDERYRLGMTDDAPNYQARLNQQISSLSDELMVIQQATSKNLDEPSKQALRRLAALIDQVVNDFKAL